MSEVKLKKKVEIDGCDGCYFNEDVYCARPDDFEKGCSLGDRHIWVIDVIDEPQSPWVKIEDAELVDGERYEVFYSVGVEYLPDTKILFWSAKFGYFLTSKGFTDVRLENVSHVIHLPKPQPPVK